MTDPFASGGYYSPIVNTSEINSSRLYRQEIHGINLDVSRMWSLVERIRSLSANSGVKVFSDQYGEIDAAIYAGIIKVFRPARIIEIGAGASTVVASRTASSAKLDCKIIAIDPYPTRSEFIALAAEDVQFMEAKVQDLQLDLFRQLQSGDILFVDSSHCAKTGSDVLDVIFRILPSLEPGVVIHFHDIFYPFEYPFEWIFVDNRSWNEAYFLRALLTGHPTLGVLLFNDLLYHDDPQRLANLVGATSLNRPGSIWLSSATS